MVISIIALLISILLPSLQRVRKQAKAVACQAKLHQSGLYFAGYAAEHDGQINMRWRNEAWDRLLPVRGCGAILGTQGVAPLSYGNAPEVYRRTRSRGTW